MLNTLSRVGYRDKVLGCWLGKNIGGTLGAPYEGPCVPHALTFYDPPIEQAAANDDLDMQLAFVAHMEQTGRFPDLDDHAAIWLKYFCGYPWDEYGFCLRNLNRGLRPPLSGWFENSYIDNMGSPIRSEIWACVAPGDPQRAACLAWHDAVMDHAGGEGVWGEMFWAAVQSAAFVCDDRDTLLDIGLTMIPPWSRIARVIRDVRYFVAHRDGENVPWNAVKQNDIWGQTREQILHRFGHSHGCHAVQNHGFTVLGWLLGKDFGDALCQAVNCGCDTDCTGATLGATLGLVGGTAGIPERWQAPVGDDIVLHYFTKRGHPEGLPVSITELTDRLMALLPTLHEPDHPFSCGRSLTVEAASLFENAAARRLWQVELSSSQARIGGRLVTVLFPLGPVWRPGSPARLQVSSDDGAPVVVAFDGKPVPVDAAGWFTLACEEDRRIYEFTVGEGQDRARFVMLGTAEAVGYPAYVNIERCKVCGGGQPARCKCVLGY